MSIQTQRAQPSPNDVSWLDTLAGEALDEPVGGEIGQAAYPVLPVRDLQVFPRTVVPLDIDSEAALEVIETALASGGLLVVAAQRNSQAPSQPSDGFLAEAGQMRTSEPAGQGLYQVGAEAKIVRVLRMPDGSTSVLVQGRRRVRLNQVSQAAGHLSAVAQPLRESIDVTPVAETLMRAVLAMFEKCLDLDPDLPGEAYVAAFNATDPGWLADLVASTLPFDASARQRVLETLDPMERLQLVSTLLARELDVLELENKIQARVQAEVDKAQREVFLREQMRVIQDELGELDEQSREVAELRAKIEAAQLPATARQRAEQELKRLAGTSPFDPEVGMVRSYLEWLVELPWAGPDLADNVDVGEVARVLAANHYGLPKAKERILEHIAVRKLAPDKMRMPILCFVGPPGTGKTSMGRSIAKALGRTFVRVSLGGIDDEAEIRGHRRTYVGSLPGRIIQAMRNAATVNPVLMLDEIDKLGLDFRGDPATALLEVLDPEQNHEFNDYYLDVPYDLSRVFFITTANLLEFIPPTLLDRMEIISFPGYVEEEKLHIARKFLAPRQIEQTGLQGHGLVFPENTLRAIIRQYTYEAGVRNLERNLASICRKAARRVAEGKDAPRRITPASLTRYLGPPQYAFGALEEQDEVGVATGVAWTEAGGDLMPVEVMVMPGKGNLLLTGQLGEIMQESAQAALSYARSNAEELGVIVDAERFDELDIHIHLPEGATPKDGPSAGITMATALVSALSGRPVRRDVGMTGEITLRGRVLPVGSLKEKAITAHRAGLKKMLIPKKNDKDLVDVPARVRREVDFVLVSTMAEVLEQALLPASVADKLPKPPRKRNKRQTGDGNEPG